MSKPKLNWKSKYADFIIKHLSFKKYLKPIYIDFKKPWWQIFVDQKWRVARQFFQSGLFYSYFTVFPILIGQSISTGNFNQIYLYVIALITIYVFLYFDIKSYIILNHTTTLSLRISAQNFFQTTDPIFHTTRSSGQILSKLNRGKIALENIMNLVKDDILGFIFRFAFLVPVLASFYTSLALTAMITLVLMIFFDSFARMLHTKIFNPYKIESGDKATAVEVESLMQINHIRSSFATPEQVQKIRVNILNDVNIMSISWRMNNLIVLIGRLILGLGLLIMSYQTVQLVQSGTLDKILAISIILAFVNVISNSLFIGKRLQELFTNINDIQNTFEFIRGFGKQTYPVLPNEKLIINNEE